MGKRKTVGNLQRFQKIRIGKKTSAVWSAFKQLPKVNGVNRAECLLCHKVFKNPGGSTTGMLSHLKRKHPEAVNTIYSNINAPMYTEEEVTPRIQRNFTATTRTRTTRMTSQKRDSFGRFSKDLHSLVASTSHNGAIGEVGETDVFWNNDTEGVPQNTYTSSARRRERTPEPPVVLQSIIDSEDVTRSIVYFLASNNFPLSTVCKPSFKTMLLNLNTMYVMEVSGQQGDNILEPIMKTTNELYEETKEKIQLELENKYISIGLEIWVKSREEIYLVITANFIGRDWCFRSKFLGMRILLDTTLISPPEFIHEQVSSVLDDVLREFKIKRNRVVTVVFNPFPFNLEVQFKILSLETKPCFNGLLRQCYQLLNDAAKPLAGCDIMEEMVKLANQTIPNFKSVKQHPGQLMKSMRTRVIFSTPEDTVTLPTSKEDIEALIKMQEPLNAIVDGLIDLPMIPASTILPLIAGLRSMFDSQAQSLNSKWSTEQKEEIVDAIMEYVQNSCKLHLTNKLLGDTTLAVCTFLDPRYKQMSILTQEVRQQVRDTVLGLLYAVDSESKMTEYSSLSDDPLELNTTSPAPSKSTTPSQSVGFKLAAILNQVVGTKEAIPVLEFEEELRQYVKELVPVITTDPYEWWSGNQHKYPTLSIVAKRYLCIGGIATSARKIFTDAGKMYYVYLANVESELVDKFQFLRQHCSEISIMEQTHNVEVEEQVDEGIEKIDIVNVTRMN